MRDMTDCGDQTEHGLKAITEHDSIPSAKAGSAEKERREESGLGSASNIVSIADTTELRHT